MKYDAAIAYLSEQCAINHAEMERVLLEYDTDLRINGRTEKKYRILEAKIQLLQDELHHFNFTIKSLKCAQEKQ